MSKIKIVVLCHFSNPEVRKHLPLSSGKLYNLVRKLIGKSPINKAHDDIAPWDTVLIKSFSKREIIELHVISASFGLKKQVVSFEKNSVHYHFLRCEPAMKIGRIIRQTDLWLRVNPMVKGIHRLVDAIQPNVVILVGLENTYYSSAVLGIKKYPVYGLCQTIYNNPERALYSTVDKISSEIELRIMREQKYFGVFCKKHYDLLKAYSPSAIVFKYGFPKENGLLNPTPTAKEYDFVNFALSLDLRKGVHDSIKAISIIKKQYPQVKLNLVGRCTATQQEELDTLIKELGLIENVFFTPFFEKQCDLFLHVQKSSFAVLPCKLDNISGTMLQSMQLGLPLVVYRTTGTPVFNREKQCVLIAEKGNVEELAHHMLSLMEKPELADMLRKNAREWQEKKYETELHNGDRLIDNCRAIIEHFNNRSPIPQTQLFNPDVDD